MRWEQLPSGRVRHPFEPMILGLALLVIPVIAFEESQLEPHWKNLADVGNWVIWLGFTTTLGRIIAIALMFIGIGFLSLLTASFAARFVEEDGSDEVKETLRSLDARLARIEQHLTLHAREESDRESR